MIRKLLRRSTKLLLVIKELNFFFFFLVLLNLSQGTKEAIIFCQIWKLVINMFKNNAVRTHVGLLILYSGVAKDRKSHEQS